MENKENKLITLSKFGEKIGVRADTIRKNIRAGGSYAKYSHKINHTIFIFYENWVEDNYKMWKMAA